MFKDEFSQFDVALPLRKSAAMAECAQSIPKWSYCLTQGHMWPITACIRAISCHKFTQRPTVQDGIYIRDFPRSLTGAAPIPAGGRADLMLRCPAANAEYQVTWGGTTIATATQLQLSSRGWCFQGWR